MTAAGVCLFSRHLANTSGATGVARGGAGLLAPVNGTFQRPVAQKCRSPAPPAGAQPAAESPSAPLTPVPTPALLGWDQLRGFFFFTFMSFSLNKMKGALTRKGNVPPTMFLIL